MCRCLQAEREAMSINLDCTAASFQPIKELLWIYFTVPYTSDTSQNKDWFLSCIPLILGIISQSWNTSTAEDSIVVCSASQDGYPTSSITEIAAVLLEAIIIIITVSCITARCKDPSGLQLQQYSSHEFSITWLTGICLSQLQSAQ